MRMSTYTRYRLYLKFSLDQNLTNCLFIAKNSEYVLCSGFWHEISRVPRVTSHMRQNNTVAEGNKLVIRRKWFWFRDVKSCGTNLTSNQGIIQVIVIYHTTPSAVYNYGRVFHHLKCFFVELVFSLRREIAANTDDVTLFRQSFKICKLCPNIVCIRHFADVMIKNLFDTKWF